MDLQESIIKQIKYLGADNISFVDLSSSPIEHGSFSNAVLFSCVLSKEYVYKVACDQHYAKTSFDDSTPRNDEFYQKMHKSDIIADTISAFLNHNGYSAFSNSENNLLNNGMFDVSKLTTKLPHKTIAAIGGVGWIGKHNLLVTKEYGSALSLGVVLTDAPIMAKSEPVRFSSCGSCNICQKECPQNAIKGVNWHYGLSRDDLIDYKKCDACLRCLAVCPWTQNYAKNNI
jgi:ferredoxin